MYGTCRLGGAATALTEGGRSDWRIVAHPPDSHASATVTSQRRVRIATRTATALPGQDEDQQQGDDQRRGADHDVRVTAGKDLAGNLLHAGIIECGNAR